MSFKKWKKLSERLFHDNGFWKYKIDRFKIEGLAESEYHYVSTPGSSMVIPITQNNKILFVEQFRYLNNKNSLEFPCGSVGNEISIKENAIKELREETGYTAEELILTGEFSPYTGASDEICSVYIGLNLAESPLPKDDTEDFILHEFTISEIEDLIDKNIIWDGLTLSAWTLSKKQILKIING